MTFLNRFFPSLKKKPLQRLVKDETRAQAEWQLLKQKLRRKVKDPSQRIRLETWGTQLFDKLRDNYHRVDSVLTTKDHKEKDRVELLLEKLENSCDNLLDTFPVRQRGMTQAQKWQKRVIKRIKYHLEFLDDLLLELEV